MLYAGGPNRLNSPEAPINPLAEGGRLLVIRNPNSGRAEEAEAHLDTLASDYDISELATVFSNPFDNADYLANNLESEVRKSKPDALVLCGGDSTAWTGVHGLFTASKFAPELRDIPLAFLAYGSGNDVALGLSKGRDVRNIFAEGRTLDYHPPRITLIGHDGRDETYYAAGNIGIGATGHAAKEFNSPEVHDHPDFKSAYRYFLLGSASLKGINQAKRFVMSEADEQGNFGPEELVFGRIFFHTLRFGITGRTKARISDPFMREALIPSKYSLRTAGYIGLFALGKTGLKIPTHVVNGYSEFKVRPREEDQSVYFHLEDSEKEINAETIFRVGLAKESAKVYTTRKRA